MQMGGGGGTAPHHKSQLHQMIAKGWRTCRLYCSSIVKPSTRRDHLSRRDSSPALLPERRRWIPAHHPCGYLCLTARKRKVRPVTRCGSSTASSWRRRGNIFSLAEERLAALLQAWHIPPTHANAFPSVWPILFRINSCFEIQTSQLCSTCGEVGRGLVGALGGGVHARVLPRHRGGSALVCGFLLILTWSLSLILSMVLRQLEQPLSL